MAYKQQGHPHRHECTPWQTVYVGISLPGENDDKRTWSSGGCSIPAARCTGLWLTCSKQAAVLDTQPAQSFQRDRLLDSAVQSVTLDSVLHMPAWRHLLAYEGFGLSQTQSGAFAAEHTRLALSLYVLAGVRRAPRLARFGLSVPVSPSPSAGSPARPRPLEPRPKAAYPLAWGAERSTSLSMLYASEHQSSTSWQTISTKRQGFTKKLFFPEWAVKKLNTTVVALCNPETFEGVAGWGMCSASQRNDACTESRL